VALYSLFLN